MSREKFIKLKRKSRVIQILIFYRVTLYMNMCAIYEFVEFIIFYMSQAKIEAIWLKTPRSGKKVSVSKIKKEVGVHYNGHMVEIKTATLVAGKGIVGNANQGGKRQVTIIEKEVWQSLMNELGVDHPPSARRANLMVSNFPLMESTGQILKIGECLLEITGETEPCEVMNTVSHGLYPLMGHNWGGGATSQVIKGGTINVGDLVSWVNASEIES